MKHAALFYCLHIFNNFSCPGVKGRPNILHRKFPSRVQSNEHATQETMDTHAQAHTLTGEDGDGGRHHMWKRIFLQRGFIQLKHQRMWRNPPHIPVLCMFLTNIPSVAVKVWMFMVAAPLHCKIIGKSVFGNIFDSLLILSPPVQWNEINFSNVIHLQIDI